MAGCGSIAGGFPQWATHTVAVRCAHADGFDLVRFVFLSFASISARVGADTLNRWNEFAASSELVSAMFFHQRGIGRFHHQHVGRRPTAY